MIWYKFHVGDYISHTAHLSPMEDLAYRRLLDLYYMSERPIPADVEKVARKIRMEISVTKSVIEEFFFLQDDGYINPRAEAELSAYSEKAERNRVVGLLGGRPRKQRLSENENPEETQMVSENNPDETQMVIFQNPNITLTDTEREKEREKERECTPQTPLKTQTKPRWFPEKTQMVSRFEEFWRAWPASPRKVGKGACAAKWKSLGLDKIADEVIASVVAKKSSTQWTSGWEPAPVTYLNQRRWEDGEAEMAPRRAL